VTCPKATRKVLLWGMWMIISQIFLRAKIKAYLTKKSTQIPKTKMRLLPQRSALESKSWFKRKTT